MRHVTDTHAMHMKCLQEHRHGIVAAFELIDYLDQEHQRPDGIKPQEGYRLRWT